MGLKKPHRSNLFIIVILTALGFLFWIGGPFIFWLILKFLGAVIDFWAMVESLSTAVAAAAGLSAGFIAYRELRAQDISRYIEVADRLYNELNSQENITARRWVFQNLSPDPKAGLRDMTDQGRDAIKQVLNSLDRVAFLTRDGWIPEEMVMPWMNPMIVKAWSKLGPYVEYEAEEAQ